MKTIIQRTAALLGCLALCLGMLAGCAGSSGSSEATVSDDAQRFTAYYFDVFDTMTQVIAYCDSQAEFDQQMEALHNDLLTYHQLYDIIMITRASTTSRPSTTTPALPRSKWTRKSSTCWTWPSRCTTPPAAS